MADQGLFGASPQDIQDLRAQQYEQAGNNFAQMSPYERGNSMLFQGAANAVAPIAGMFGGRDRQVVVAEQMQALQSKIDHNTPEGLMQGAKVFQDAGKPDMARRYVLAAQSMLAQAAQMAQHNADARYKNAQADQAMRTNNTPNMPPAAQLVRYYSSLPDKTTEEAQQLKKLIDATIQKTNGTGTAPTALRDIGIPQKTIDFYAQQSISGDNSWQVGLARGKVGQKLIAAVKDRIPQLAQEMGMTPQDASANKDTRASLAKTLSDRQKFVSSANQFVGNFKKQMDLVESYAKPGLSGESPVLNRWIRAGRQAIDGDPDVTALDTAIRGAAREHQRIVTGVTSNAQLHVAAQHTADQLLNANMTPAQLVAALKVMREESQNALDSGNSEVEYLRNQLKGIGRPKNESNASTPADVKTLYAQGKVTKEQAKLMLQDMEKQGKF